MHYLLNINQYFLTKYDNYIIIKRNYINRVNQYFLCEMKSIINLRQHNSKNFVTKIYFNHLTIIQKCFVLLKSKK